MTSHTQPVRVTDEDRAICRANLTAYTYRLIAPDPGIVERMATVLKRHAVEGDDTGKHETPRFGKNIYTKPPRQSSGK
ncbi:hypothetical protein HYS00_04570 [Candidatus Microgenomates bacterium]|nr:hypothetical protein [Candidatus Microgenomates bacterium]